MKLIKHVFLVMILLLVALIPASSQVVSSNVLTRVFLIKYNNNIGSSFTIEIQNRQYLVTARHLVNGIKDGDAILIFYENQWKTIKVKPLYTQPSEVDIVVLVPPAQISPSFPLEASMANLFISQDMYFVGFPYALSMEGHNLNNGFPLPFVKKGICSAFIDSSSKDYTIIVVDGINNPGFSGGPIVFMDQHTKTLKVAGVVSGYRTQDDKVMNKGSEVGTVQSNSGLLIGFNIKSAVDVILKNPIGPIVKN